MQPEQPQAPQAPQMPPTPAPQQPEPQLTPPATPPQQPAMQQPAAPTPSAPQYQQACWYVPEGSWLVFSAKRCLLTLHPGWLIITRKSDNVELKRIQLANDLHIKYFFNYARISQSAGQKHGVFTTGYSFLIGSAIGYGLIIFTGLIRLVLDANQLVSGASTTGVGTLIATAGLIVGLILMALEMSKAKAFIAACKKAAGIA